MSTQPAKWAAPGDVRDSLAEGAEKVREKTAEAAEKTVASIDEKRAPAADALERAAGKLHSSAGRLPGGENVTNIAHRVADGMESTARYVRRRDLNDMLSDMERIVRDHPGQSLAAAAVLGFLIGRSFRND